MRVDNKDGKYVLEREQIGEAEIAKSVKKHEKRQWLLRYLWISKLGLILVLLSILTKLVISYPSKLVLSFAALIIEEIVRR